MPTKSRLRVETAKTELPDEGDFSCRQGSRGSRGWRVLQSCNARYRTGILVHDVPPDARELPNLAHGFQTAIRLDGILSMT